MEYQTTFRSQEKGQGLHVTGDGGAHLKPKAASLERPATKGVVTLASIYWLKASWQPLPGGCSASKFLIFTRIGPAICHGRYSPICLAASALQQQLEFWGRIHLQCCP